MYRDARSTEHKTFQYCLHSLPPTHTPHPTTPNQGMATNWHFGWARSKTEENHWIRKALQSLLLPTTLSSGKWNKNYARNIGRLLTFRKENKAQFKISEYREILLTVKDKEIEQFRIIKRECLCHFIFEIPCIVSLYYIKNQQDATLTVLFICNCKIILHVSEAFCVHHQEY